MYLARVIPVISLALLLSVSFLACDSGSSTTDLELRRLLTRINELERDVDGLKVEQREFHQKLNQRASMGIKDSTGAIQTVEVVADGSELDDPYVGLADAPLSLVMFANYQCQTCRKFAMNSLKKLKSEFVTSGKLKFIFRDMPLKSHPLAVELASLANCAGEQGKYWEAFELLYSEKLDPLIDPMRKELSKLLPKPKSFLRCSKSSRYQKEIELDAQNARSLGASGTPSFLLMRNGVKPDKTGILIRGAQPLAVFQKEISRLLEEAQ